MRQDMHIGTASCHFTLRSAALIIKDGCLLAVKHDNYDCYYTIGGGVEINESTADAVLREIYEETGVRANIDRLVYVQERFYETCNKKHHEITFFYLIESANFFLSNGACTDHTTEHMYWLPIQELTKYPLVPEFLHTALCDIPQTLQHVISRETA